MIDQTSTPGSTPDAVDAPLDPAIGERPYVLGARARAEDFPRNTGAGGYVEPDRPPNYQRQSDAEANIIPTDSPGG